MNNLNIKLFKSILGGSLVVAVISSGICLMGANNAKNSALNHAGFSKQDVKLLKWDFDIDNFTATYDVEWYYNNREYDYTIDAITSEVLKYEIE